MLDGTALEELGGLMADYNRAALDESNAVAAKAALRERILTVLREGGEREVSVGGYKATVTTLLSRTIPLKAAEQLLERSLLENLIQEKASIVLRVTREVPGP